MLMLPSLEYYQVLFMSRFVVLWLW